MAWLALLGGATAMAIAVFAWRWWFSPWREVKTLIATLVDQRPPGRFLIRGNRHARHAGLLLEHLYDRYAQLESRVVEDEFSVRAILSAMPDGLAVVDTQRRARLVNPRLRELFKLRENDAEEFLIGVVRDSEADACVRRAIEQGQSCVSRIRLLRGSEARDLEVKAEPIRENDKSVRGAVVLFRDVTDLNRGEQVRRDFVANVSHELRTPLSILRGYLETLLANPKQPPRELLRIFETMEKHSNRLRLLVEDVLSLAQLEAPEARLDLEKVRLQEWLPMIARDWKSALETSEQTLDLQIEASLPAVLVDPTRLQEVVYNLLDNAVKYSAENGRITISAVTDSSFVALSVEDTGIGISRRDLPRIFERFYRADKARSQQVRGTGLGLSIVKHIVLLHKGTVEVESELGKGTRITVRLPLDSPAEATVTETSH